MIIMSGTPPLSPLPSSTTSPPTSPPKCLSSFNKCSIDKGSTSTSQPLNIFTSMCSTYAMYIWISTYPTPRRGCRVQREADLMMDRIPYASILSEAIIGMYAYCIFRPQVKYGASYIWCYNTLLVGC